jgi:ribosome-associated translation inhibitor RaiA
VQIDIQSRGFEISHAARNVIQKRIRHTFRYHNTKVRKVVVRLFSSIGSRGETLKSCRVQTIANGVPQLVTERKSDYLMEAANTSIHVANKAMIKQFDKLKSFKHIPASSLDGVLHEHFNLYARKTHD